MSNSDRLVQDLHVCRRRAWESHDQIGRWRSLLGGDFQAVIKSAASAVYLRTKELSKQVTSGVLSTRIKDVGVAIRHSRGYIISILQGLEMGWRGWEQSAPRQEITKTGKFTHPTH